MQAPSQAPKPTSAPLTDRCGIHQAPLTSGNLGGFNASAGHAATPLQGCTPALSSQAGIAGAGLPGADNGPSDVNANGGPSTGAFLGIGGAGVGSLVGRPGG